MATICILWEVHGTGRAPHPPEPRPPLAFRDAARGCPYRFVSVRPQSQNGTPSLFVQFENLLAIAYCVTRNQADGSMRFLRYHCRINRRFVQAPPEFQQPPHHRQARRGKTDIPACCKRLQRVEKTAQFDRRVNDGEVKKFVANRRVEIRQPLSSFAIRVKISARFCA